jgi:site-specific DNA-methyltransferase (adenine-specific)
MSLLDEASIDAIVTDPPYELGFMGKSWDSTGIANSVAMWREALRVLKPGGHLLAFSGTRTYHRMACAIEDAGFEIRDQIGWAYATGFPKSLDVSKAIDKAAGAEREVIGYDAAAAAKRTPAIGTAAYGDYKGQSGDITAPATEAARQWQGWGTALKPAWEPIVVARKPLIGTVAANVLEHGTGALNIDGCRVGTTVETWPTSRSFRSGISSGYTEGIDKGATQSTGDAPAGRWPANIIHDGSDEVLALFPQSGGQRGAVSGDEPSSKTTNTFGEFAGRTPSEPRGDQGSAARFFYVAKASKSDRGEGNNHPTVKPTDLMRYLCRLVTPPGGLVLDPFTGSGSTGKAAKREGFRFIGFEMNPEYAEIARRRIG